MKKIFLNRALYHWFQSQCQSFLAEEEMENVFFMLVSHIYNIGKIDFLLSKEYYSTTIWEPYIKDIQAEKPIQYILNYAYFENMKLNVNEHCLIPRPETEELSKWIKDSYASENPMQILDIGTGSACLAISLKKYFDTSKVFASDISEHALLIARKNADQQKADIYFYHDDILQSKIQEEFDIIVSNPPYIEITEKQELQKRVVAYEPHLALFVPENQALLFYDAILQFAKSKLRNEGSIFFEIHELKAKEIVALVEKNNFKAELRKDIYGKYRILRATKKRSA